MARISPVADGGAGQRIPDRAREPEEPGQPVDTPLGPERPNRGGLGHLPALDGLRGVAVLSVLLFHGGVSWLPGGFLGVDVFFVLSGFLITSLLLDEHARSGTVRLGAFWARRARRLLPALVLLVAGVSVYAWLVATPEARPGIRSDVFSTLGYAANWHFIANQSSYFARTADPSPLAHTWSLAIEEQFYVVWPLLVLAAVRLGGGLRRVGVIAGSGLLASATLMALLYAPGSDPSRVYYGTDTRSQVLMVGALLAVVLAAWRRRPTGRAASVGPRILVVASFPAAAVVGVAMYRAHGSDAWVYRGGLTGVALAVAVMIGAAASSPRSPVGLLLSGRILRWVGRISYGMYLYHWPIFLVVDHGRTGLLGPRLLAARMGATVVAAVLSYHLVEMPVRRGLLRRWRGVVSLPVAAAASVAATLAATAVPSAAAGLPAAARRAMRPPPVAVVRSSRPARLPGQPVKVMFVGDSVAETLAVGMQSAARRDGVEIDNQGTLGCGIVRGGPYRYFGGEYQELSQCREWPERWKELVASDRPDVVFLVVGRWEVMDRVHDGVWTHLGDPGFDAYVESELDRAVDVLGSQGAAVGLATAPYYLRGERPDGGRWPEDDPARVDDFNGLVRRVAARHPRTVALIDLGGHTSVGGTYTPYVDGIEMRYDGVHFTPRADAWLEPWLIPQLAALAPPVSAGGPGTGTGPPSRRAGG